MTTETNNHNQPDASTAFLRAARAGQLDKILALLNQDIDINVSNANGLNAMHLASKDGHAAVVEALIERGALIDAATRKGNTALHIAALAGQDHVVRLLVQHGAQVNIQSQNGFTPLYMAAQENHDAVVKFLLGNGANQSLATEDGFTPLAVAMQQGHEKVVAVLLEADTGRVRLPALHIAAKKDDCKAAALLLENDHNPDVTSKSGFTPLHIAAHYGNEAVAKLLLAKGADVNCTAKHNISPLHVAAKWGKANMVVLLADHGAQVDARTRDGLTPLHCAARSGHEHVVDMLLDRGAPITGKSKNGLAPLHMAAQGDHTDAARILLYHRAPVDDLTVDYLTALHVAAHCGHVKVAKLLLDRNADANARALNGFTPLHIACKKNRIKVVELLLKYGASISATTESGLTPLHVAAFMGCMNIVIYLLQHEASPDVPTVRGETPLHLAARANQTDIIRILLRNGAAVEARARESQTALHIASRLGNVDIVLLLVQHGAQLDALTADNYNALHIAAKQHNHEVAAVLLEHGAPPNAVTKKGFTPLHLAAKYGNLKVANLLMQQQGAELDPKGKNGVTPLHVAAQYKHHAVASALLEKGADPKAVAKNGHTPLHIAARKNQMETAAALMDKGAIVDAESKAGCTPLHLAAHQGHAEMCSLLIEQGADPSKKAKTGLAALHLAAQEDHVPVAKIQVNNNAKVDVCTKGGYTPLHVASHFGQTNMVKFLLETGADVHGKTCHGYTALHHAAQQGHINIVNLLVEHKADANATTNNGQTPFDIAQKLGYVTVMETLKGVSEPSPGNQTKDDKYKPVAPETMYETFMSDSEEEGGEDTMLTDQPYRYLTVDDMKSLGDDSLPIDVTRDEREPINHKGIMEVSTGSAMDGSAYVIDELTTAKAVNHLYNTEVMKEGYCYNVETTQPNFLVSFLVDARGGAMKGCRGSGVRVIVPPLSAQQPTRITCRYVRPQRVNHMPPLMEGEALASRVLELGPVSAKFIGPIILEVPHFASLRGKEREIVILRSDNGTTWREHSLEAADCTVQDILNDTLEIEELPEDAGSAPTRVTRILTHDFPQYFAVISRIRQEVHAIGPEGGMVSSSVVPQVQAVFPQGALTKKIKVGLQAQTIEAELTAKLLGRGVAVSPVVTVEPRRRKFHKAITLSMPAPRPHTQGMINTYTTSAPTLRLLCSISGVFRKRSLEGGTNRAHWEDVTDSTPLTFVNDCVSFTTTVSARYWLMDCRNVSEATKMATELYREAIHVPFMAKFVVYAKRTEQLQAQLRVFCVTDDREEKTLERMERFSQVAKSKDVEVHENKPIYLEFGGNFAPVVKSGEQPKLEFKAFRESRLKLGAMVRGAHADAVARCQFMREPKRPKGEPPQSPICVLNIVLPEEIFPQESMPLHAGREEIAIIHKVETPEIHLSDNRLTAISNLLGMDWVPLAYEMGVSSSVVANIREKGLNGAQQAVIMLKLWREQGGPKVQGNQLQLALCRIGREDVLVPQSMADTERRIQRNIYQERQSSEEIVCYKSPDRDPYKPERFEASILERDDYNKELERDEVEHTLRKLQESSKPSMDDSIGERDEAKYSPEEKSYDGSDKEVSQSVSEESEEEEVGGMKKSVAERKIQITRKLSSGKIPASKQKKELKEEMIEIKKQINPEIKKFHVKQTSLTSQTSQEKKTEEKKKPEVKPEPPKEKVLPKAAAGSKNIQKHIRNESMIRFSSGDFSDVKVPQQKVEEKVAETKTKTTEKVTESKTKATEKVTETKTKITEKVTDTKTKAAGKVTESKTKVTEKLTTKTASKPKPATEKDIAEAPLHKKINVFESKKVTEKVSSTSDNKIKLTEAALKKHTKEFKTPSEYTDDFVKNQILCQEQDNKMKQEEAKELVGSPELEVDFATELMKAEETFRAAAEKPSDKYKENYFEGGQVIPHMFTKSMRTDSTIVQFSSEEDKKSLDSETETDSQISTVKQRAELINEKTRSISKSSSGEVKSPKPVISIQTSEFSSPQVSIEKTFEKSIGSVQSSDKLRVDSLEDSMQISSDEEAQIQPTDDESESQQKEQIVKVAKTIVESSKPEGLKTETIHKFEESPRHASKESSIPSQSKTDSLIESVQDDSYISQSESKIYSKDSRPTRSDSLDEASQFSDMEETQIGMTSKVTEKICPKVETMKFLEQESKFSTKELQDKYEKKDKVEEPVISAKARQFIETVPEDDTSVQECFFSKRIYSDSLEESEQYATDDSRRHSEADSVKSDHSGKDDFRMSKISSDIEEADSEVLEDLPKTQTSFEFVTKKESKESSQESLYKKTIKRHSRNESISLTKLSSLESKDSDIAQDTCQRATEFQMFVTEAEDIQDEQISSFDREEFSDKISSESSREIEISDKKTSDDKISSESGVTDKVSDDSDLKLSTDTLQYSPQKGVETTKDVKQTTKESPVEMRKSEQTGFEDAAFKTTKRTSLSSSFGDNSGDLLPRAGKRASDAPSLTDSKDYTFEESEDSIPKYDLEVKAKAILEPIYDKALKTVRGDSLDDVEAFCLDVEESETTRLPHILESQYTEDSQIIKSETKIIDKFSVHSSPDEIEEKISTETESDQAKVLEIIEPTSEGEIGYLPSFDTSKLKQDSLDDADDFLQEKEQEFSEHEKDVVAKDVIEHEYISGFISKAGATIAASIGVKLQPEDTSHPKVEEIEKHLEALVDNSKPSASHDIITQSSFNTLFTEASSTLAKSIGIDIGTIPETEEKPLERRKSIVDALADCGETASATIGVQLPHEHKTVQRKSSIAEALEESGEIMSATVGVEIPHAKNIEEHKTVQRRSSIAEALEESGEMMSATIGIKLPHEVKTEEHTIQRKSSISEALEESGELMSATVGIKFPREVKAEEHKTIQRKSSISEALEESGELISATIGIKLPHEVKTEEHTTIQRRSSISEALEESGELMSATVGIKLPHEVKAEDHKTIQRKSSIAEALEESGELMSATVGIKHPHEDKSDDHKTIQRKSSIAEALEESGEMMSATIGIKLPHEVKTEEHTTIQRRTSIAEVLEESSEIMSATIGVEIPHKKEIEESKIIQRKSSVAEALEESGELMSATVGIKLPHEVETKEPKTIERKNSIAEALEESGELMSATIGVEIPHKKEVEDSKIIQRKSSVAEALEESGELMSATIGVEIHHNKEIEEQKTIQRKSSVAEALEESGELMSATIGVEIHHNKEIEEQKTIQRKSSIAEALEESGELMSATIGVKLPHEVKTEDLTIIQRKGSIAEALAECGETVSASVGIELHHEQQKDDTESEKILSEMKDLNRMDRRCSDLLEGISQPGGSIIKIDTTHVTPGLPSKFSKTPPPSPVDLIQREKHGHSTPSDLLGQQTKGPVTKSEQKLSPRDERLSFDTQQIGTKKVSPPKLTPVSPTRHRADISFVNVDELTIHPKAGESVEETAEHKEKVISTAEDLISGVERRALDTVEEIQKQIRKTDESQKAFREETRRQFEEMKRDFEKNSIEKFKQMKAEFESSDRFSAENLRSDPLRTEYKESLTSEKITSEQEKYSERKETKITDTESTSKTETERDISGHEYKYKEKESLETKGEELAHEIQKVETVQSVSVNRKDQEQNLVRKESDDSVLKKDEKQHLEKGLYSGRQSKSEEKMSALRDEVNKQSEISYSERDISHEQWGKEYFAEKLDEEPKETESTEGSPKSKIKAFKQEETYDVDFIKELKVSSSQVEKDSVSHTVSSSTKTEIHRSPIHKPEEHIQEYVWETSVQQQDIEETITDLQDMQIKTEDAKLIYEPEPSSKSFSISDRASESSERDSKTRNDDFDSFRDSMIKSGESVETEYMIKSIDSQEAETLHKSLDSVSAETMQTSDKDEYPAEADSFIADLKRQDENKLVKEKSLDDICSSGYDTDLSSAEFLASKLELDRADIEFGKARSSLAELSEVEKTIDEVKQSLEAAQDEIISEKNDGSFKYKQSPSEFEFKLISPDRPEIIPESPEKEKSESKFYTSQETKSTSATSSKVEVLQEVVTIEKDSSSKDDVQQRESDSSFKSEENRITTIEKDFSDKSTVSGPSSLIDNENEFISDKDESLKSSPEIKLRPMQKHVKSTHLVADRRSGSDAEGWSSSGESHYQSFEHTDSPHSRPLSSDVENLLTSHSTTEFQSALTSQDVSSRSQKTSKEYYTAVGSLSSRDSMKSLDSESSGHLASMDISDASETLVPTATELREEMMESGNFSEAEMATSYIHVPEETREDISDFIGIPAREKISDLSEEGSQDDELAVQQDDSEVVCKMKRSHEMSFQPNELLPEQFPTESSDVEIDTHISASESQTFSLSKIETGPSTVVKRHIKETETSGSKSLSQSPDKSKSYKVSEKIVEYRTSSVVYKTPEKKPKPPSDSEITIQEKSYSVSRIPVSKTTTVTVEKREFDLDSLEGEIIQKGTKEYEEIDQARVLSSSFSGTSTFESPLFDKKSSGPYSLDSKDSKQSSTSSLKIQDDYLSTPQTPLSNPSQSSESTDNGREYVLDDMYEISEGPEFYHSERATDSKSEMSVTAEERTLYEAHKDPDSPMSEEFEMVDKPNEMDDFVVIEEVAKEASEFDTEGKSIAITSKGFSKKHDTEVEEYLTQANKKTIESEYSTSGSLSEEEMLQYELDQKKIRAAEMAEIEAGKKWIQMQFEGDLTGMYDRGPLEDIKEEEMTDFDASRIGSFASQKESVGSFGSMKNSFGSLSESDILLRKRYMMRTGEPDDVSVSSLQEFENLEQALSMENYQTSSSSQDSLNGSLPKRYATHKKNSQGDDVSTASLKEFEGLETACIEVIKLERSAKQKEAMLFSQDGRISSAGFLDNERMSYSRGSSESSPPQKSGSPSQKSGSPGVKSGSPSQKSGSPGQKYGSPSQKTVEATAIKRMIDEHMSAGGDQDTNNIKIVSVQKKSFDNRGAFYVPDLSGSECTDDVCVKKQTYECTTDDGQCRVITKTEIIKTELIPQEITGIDIPGMEKKDEAYDSGSFQGSEVGSIKSMTDYGSEFSSSVTSQQSDTESLVTMIEQHSYFDTPKHHSLETQKVSLDLSRKSDEDSEILQREISPMSGRSSSGVLSTMASKHFTDPASGSWSGLDEDMSSSGSFSRASKKARSTSTEERTREDLMLGSTDSLEQTSSNATRATYNYEVDTPMTGSLTSAGSNTMVSSLETLEPVTMFDKDDKTLHVSTEDCFAMDHSGSERTEYEVKEPDSEKETSSKSKSGETSGQSTATFYIGDTPIPKSDNDAQQPTSPPVPAKRRSLADVKKQQDE